MKDEKHSDKKSSDAIRDLNKPGMINFLDSEEEPKQRAHPLVLFSNEELFNPKKQPIPKFTPLPQKPSNYLDSIPDFVGSAPTSDEELQKRFEDEHPNKHAVWRGRTTKQFLQWKQRNLLS